MRSLALAFLSLHNRRVSVQMCSLRSLACLVLVLLRSPTVNGLSCLKFDESGGTLKFGNLIEEGDLICTYSNGALCAYSVDGHEGVGELDLAETEDSDDVCPTNLNGSTSSSSQSSSSSQDQGTTHTPTRRASRATRAATYFHFVTWYFSFAFPRLFVFSECLDVPRKLGNKRLESFDPKFGENTTMNSASPTGVPTARSDRKSTPAAVIAGFVVAICLVGGVLFLVWLRRRRRRAAAETLPHPYEKAEIPVSPLDTQTPPDLPPAEQAPGKIGATAVDASEAGLVQADVMAQPEAREEADEEPLRLRLQRVEAQLEVLFASRVPTSAPPSYRDK